LTLGAARVTLINLGHLRLTLAEIMPVPEEEWRPQYTGIFDQPLSFPSQCLHLALADASVLVDANNFALSAPPGSPYAPPAEYQPPPDLLTQLREGGISPEEITHVVITHAHHDHYVGITHQCNGHAVPSFPRARYWLGKPDWDHPDMQEALHDPTSVESQTLGVIEQAGLLELVEGHHDLTSSVRILAAPGESPGHQIVRVASQGQVLYGLGDLYHHPLEVEHPSWMAEWDDVPATIASRLALSEAALAEHALLIAAHIPGFGRLERTATGLKWTHVQ
jgi:glyoxylase-like metal-dependent hydrolase (beta-lactamase superfamily II)